MPFLAHDRPDSNLCLTELAGTITDEELLDYYRERLERGTFRPAGLEVVDGRRVENFDITRDGHRQLVDLFDAYPDAVGDVRWAFIGTSPLSFGMFRMFEGQAGTLPFTFGVFRTRDAAAEWLGVDAQALEVPSRPRGGRAR